MKKVDKWLERGRKNCREGNHWLILDYGDCLICPVCNHKESSGMGMSEYNCFLVTAQELVKAQ